MRRLDLGIALGAIALLGLLSCTRPYAVWLLPGARLPHLAFGLARTRGGSEVLPVNAITVQRCFGRKYARPEQALWYIVNEGSATELHRVVYGTVPAGFTERRGPEPLQPGECYAIAAWGPGLSGSTEFRVLADSSVVERSKAEQRAAADSAFRREVAFGDSAVAYCRRAFATASTPRDTAHADSLTYRDPTGEFDGLGCAFLRSKSGGGLRND